MKTTPPEARRVVDAAARASQLYRMLSPTRRRDADGARRSGFLGSGEADRPLEAWWSAYCAAADIADIRVSGGGLAFTITVDFRPLALTGRTLPRAAVGAIRDALAGAARGLSLDEVGDIIGFDPDGRLLNAEVTGASRSLAHQAASRAVRIIKAASP
jgi:hypothetical protein